MRRLIAVLSIAALQIFAVACGTTEVLQPLSATVPYGVDLSGIWTLRKDDSDGADRINQAIGQTDSRPRRIANAVGQEPRNSRGGLVHVFLETGKVLKVTQTPFALFISLDRAIVVEFRFGESRMVSVGEIEAQRVSGWVDQSYVVETLDKNGMKLVDKFWLSDDATQLHREMTFRSRKSIESTVHQIFDKTAAGKG